VILSTHGSCLTDLEVRLNISGTKEVVFRALADPTRCRIIELLARCDLTAGEIAEEFPIAFASVSQQRLCGKNFTDMDTLMALRPRELVD